MSYYFVFFLFYVSSLLFFVVYVCMVYKGQSLWKAFPCANYQISYKIHNTNLF
jgi:hypothetical protein